MTIGEKIRYIRKEKGLTQKELSKRSGIAEITIRQYEASKYNPKPGAIMKLCVGLDCKISDIIDDDHQKYYRMFDDIINDATTFISSAKTEKELDIAEGFTEILEKSYKQKYSAEVRLLASFDFLNDKGKEKAIEYIEDLYKIPEYKREID